MFEVKISFADEAEYLDFASALYAGRAHQAAILADSQAEKVDAVDPTPPPTVDSPPMSETVGKPAKAKRTRRTKAEVAAAKKAAADALAAPPAGAEPAAPEGMTLEKLRGIVREYAQKNGTDNITKALAKFGVKRLPDLSPEQMAELATALSA